MISLIINNNLISSYEDLKLEVLSIKNSQSHAAKEVRAYFRDGVLCDWLNEGDDNEKVIASQLKTINPQQDDTSLLREIISTICGVKVVNISKIDSSKCLSLVGLEYSDYSFNDCRIIESDKISISSNARKLYLKINFKVLESYNDIFLVSVYTNESVGKSKLEFFKKDLNLSRYKQGEICSFSVCYHKEIYDGMSFDVYIEDRILKSIILHKGSTVSTSHSVQKTPITPTVHCNTKSKGTECQSSLHSRSVNVEQPSYQKKQQNSTQEPKSPKVRVIYE